MSSYFEVNQKCIGIEKMQHIKNTHVAVVGLGGLGCSVAMGLVRLGIHKIRLVDHDNIECSNIPRQILFGQKDVGLSKVQTAKHSLLQVFDDLDISCEDELISIKNGIALLKDIDIVIDCTDNFIARYAISKSSETLNIPMIYGGVQNFEGQVGIFNYKNSKPFHVIFPNIESLLLEDNCEASGVLPFVVQTVANMQVIEAYKIICNDVSILNNKLLCVNVLSNKSRILNLKS